MNVIDIIAFISKRRKELGLSQNDIGNKIGYSSQLVFNWEKGKSLPDLSSVSELCKALEISLDDFFNCQVSEKTKEEIKPFNIDDFSKCLKKLRVENNLTQQDFAKKIGVSFPTVIAWEKGKSTPSIKDFLVICETYELDPSSFYYGKIQKNNNPIKKPHKKKKFIIPLLLAIAISVGIIVPVSLSLNKSNTGSSGSESILDSSLVINSSSLSSEGVSSSIDDSSSEVISSSIERESSSSIELESSSSEVISSSNQPEESSSYFDTSSSKESESKSSSSSETPSSSEQLCSSSEVVSSSIESESSSSSETSSSSEQLSSSSEPISSSIEPESSSSSSEASSSSEQLSSSSEPISSSLEPESSSSEYSYSSSYLPEKRKITFLSDDKSTVLHTLYFDDGERVYEINYIPIKESSDKIYIFKGWDLDDDSLPDKINIIMDHDYILVAVFEEVDKVTSELEYTVEKVDVNKVKIVSCVDTKGKSEITLPNYIDKDRVVEIGESIFHKDSSITKIIIPEGIEVFDSNCFNSLSALKEVVFPPSIDNVGRNAFNKDAALEKVVMPVEYCVFGANCFYNCSSLTSIDVSCLTMLNSNMFQNCTNLEEITGLENIKTIAPGVTSNTKIRSLIFPKDDMTVFDNAFTNMGELEHLEFLGSIYSLGNNEFVGCDKLETIIYPKNINYWYASKKSISEECKTIYYKGNLEDFSLLHFEGEYKYGLYDNVNVYCYSEVEAPHCWRYVNNIPTKY